MKVGFIFPGQGSQHPGMGKDIYERFESARDVYSRASDICNLDIPRISFERPARSLNHSGYTQLSILTMSLAIGQVLTEHGIRSDVMAGHSLGEYSALISAGTVDFTDGFSLVKKREELMEVSGKKNPGGMAAVIGLSYETVAALCRESDFPVWPANMNTPEQIVISGTKQGIMNVMKTVRLNQGKAVELKVTGAFHSPLMKEAAISFASAVQQVSLKKPQCPIIGNTDAKVKTTPDQFALEMKTQMLSPVLWLRSIEQMKQMGVTTFIEVGPNKILKGLLLKIDRKLKVFTTGTLRELDQTIQAVA